jgi:hypothetical protein
MPPHPAPAPSDPPPHRPMDTPTTSPATRRPYAAPTLVVYGDLRSVTLSNATNNMNDKGNGSFSMT